MTSAIDQKIKAHVDQFTSQLTDLIHEAAMASVQQALANLGMGGAPAARVSAKVAVKRKPGRPVGSGGGDTAALAERVSAFVASKDGVGLGEIAKSVKAKKPAVQRAIGVLLDARSIKKTGEKRGTLYFGK